MNLNHDNSAATISVEAVYEANSTATIKELVQCTNLPRFEVQHRWQRKRTRAAFVARGFVAILTTASGPAANPACTSLCCTFHPVSTLSDSIFNLNSIKCISSFWCSAVLGLLAGKYLIDDKNMLRTISKAVFSLDATKICVCRQPVICLCDDDTFDGQYRRFSV